MSSDVEMLDDKAEKIKREGREVQVIQLLSRSPSPTHHSPISVDDDSVPSTPPPLPHSPSAGPSTSGPDDTAPSTAKEPRKRAKAAPPASARPPSSAQPGAKPPKSAKSAAPRSPSPSPPPPPARPPLQTIRLEITLGGPEHYEVDIGSMSKESGQRAPTPVPVKRDSSDSSGEDDADGEGDGKHEKKKRRKKKNIAQEYYDVSDPFIDDSELAVDERMYFAQTKQQGFYVSSGQVALLTDKPPPKPKSKKKVTVLPPAASISAALSSALLPPLSVSNANAGSTSAPKSRASNGTKSEGENGESVSMMSMSVSGMLDEPSISVVGASGALKRKSPDVDVSSPVPSQGGKKKRKMIEIRPFNPELETMIEELKGHIAKENWETKGRFPQDLKPLLAQVALKAIILGEYDDNFFNYMPKIFPYNRFTMMKLIKRTVWRDHTNLLTERSKELLKDLEKLAEDGFGKAKEEWEKAVIAWEKRERAKADGPHAPSAEGTPSPSSAQPTPSAQPTGLPRGDDTGNDTAAEHEHEHGDEHEDEGQEKAGGAAGGGGGGGKESHPPAKKYRLTDKMKAIIWQLVCLSNECCRIENEKNQLENSNQVVSDQGVRKTLYQKIVAAFPKDWITSGQVSREVSVMKKKYEKEQENE